MIDRTHDLPVTRQCKILSLARSTAYYEPVPTSAEDLALMRRIDELHLEHPFAGSRMLRDLLRSEGYRVGRKHVRTLMKKMGIEALYRKPNTSKRHAAHRIYPYLLSDLTIDRPNHVWATDITYIPMRRGFIYLVAVLDWATRRVLSWRVSNTLTTDFCLDAVREAIARYGCPEIFNTDQGCQFTSGEFTGLLKEQAFRSAWTEKGAGATTSSSSACGKASSMKKFTCEPMTRFSRRRRTWEGILISTTVGDRINRLTDRRRIRFTSTTCRRKKSRHDQCKAPLIQADLLSKQTGPPLLQHP